MRPGKRRRKLGTETDQSVGLTREHVFWGYRLFLDREPEGDLAIQQKLAAHATTNELRRDFISSAEFRNKNNPDMAYTPTTCVVIKELASGPRLFVDLSDSAIGLNVVREKYETNETRFIEKTLRSGDSVVDIGANIGFHTIQMASWVGASGRVYAFEPIPQNLALLRKSIVENGFEDRIILEPVAVGDQARRIEIVFLPLEKGAFNSGGAYLRTSDEAIPPGHETLISDVIRLDEYKFQRSIRFLKIDIEGAEPLAFRGAARILTADRPIILSEINPQQLARVSRTSPAGFIRDLAQFGYRCRLLENGLPGQRINDTTDDRPVSVVFEPV